MAGLLTGARTIVSPAITRRLSTLNLIEIGDVPVDPAVTAQFDTEVIAWRARVRKAVTQGRWDDIEECCPAHLQRANRPVRAKGFVVTEHGKQILSRGAGNSHR